MLSSASELFPESLVACQYRKSCNGSVSSCVSKPHKTNRACASYVRSALGKKPVWEPACFRETGIIITTCINVPGRYICSYRGEEEILWQSAERQDASPHNVLSVLTEVVWATGCTLRVRESRTSQPRTRRNDLFVPVELVSCRWQQSQGGYKRSWRRFGSHETRTPTLNGLQCPNIKQASTKAEQCKEISHRGR